MEITPFDLQKTEEEIAILSAEHDALKSTLDRIHTLIDLRESRLRLKNKKKHTTITSLRRKRKYTLQRDVLYQMLLARRTEGEKKIASVLTALCTLKERITYEQIKNKYRANMMEKTKKTLQMRQDIANSNQRLLRDETQQANRIADLLKALRKKITQRYLFSLLALLPVVVCMELLTLQVNALTQGVIITIEWVLLFVVAYIVWLATMSKSARALMQRYIMLRDTPLHDEYVLHYQKQIDQIRAELVEKQKELDELEAQQAKEISDAVADTPETC